MQRLVYLVAKSVHNHVNFLFSLAFFHPYDDIINLNTQIALRSELLDAGEHTHKPSVLPLEHLRKFAEEAKPHAYANQTLITGATLLPQKRTYKQLNGNDNLASSMRSMGGDSQRNRQRIGGATGHEEKVKSRESSEEQGADDIMLLPQDDDDDVGNDVAGSQNEEKTAAADVGDSENMMFPTSISANTIKKSKKNASGSSSNKSAKKIRKQ